ncbi:chromosome condensation protein CrcB [Halalkalibacillus sediminis]|uniref:Fluoride-specific ion channel FluC n=1 Tax=Halalkalibacillus sediminis TaxID=2018042 RepID=A0A2I0QQU1_9BACI|nr:CrcB family protein [Halalkalibacillus sediminis]PKR76688.1 chromosome condensation protein CrcB [Halalkalibacillus sediminis]
MKKLIVLWLAVAAGGMIGTYLRYLAHPLTILDVFPLGTLLVNVIGSLILGAFTAYSNTKSPDETFKVFVGVGFCGGLTTMSTFAADSFTLMTPDYAFLFIGYVALSFIGGIASAAIGYLATLKVMEAK